MYDVIVVGGGIIGAASAYYLAEAGQKVLLLERRNLMTGTTSQAASVLIRHRPHPAVSKMVGETFAQIDRFEREEGGCTGFKAVGCVHVGSSKEDLFESSQGLTPEPIRDLDKADLKQLLPWLRLKDSETACFVETDGYVDSYSLGMAYVKAARKAGAELREHAPVDALIKDERGQVIGVESKGQPVLAHKVVLACGPWTNELLKTISAPVMPMAPVRSQYWMTGADALFESGQAICLIPGAKAYTRPDTTHLLFGLRDDAVAYANPQDLPNDIHAYAFHNDPEGWEALEAGFESLADYIPAMNELSIKHYAAGVSSYTPDGKYIIDTVPGFETVIVAGGCSGAGIATSAGFGRLVSELVLDQEPFAELSSFRFDRFGPVEDNDEFRRRCAMARSNKR